MTTDAKERVCKVCGETYPLTAEYWQPQKQCKDGFRQPCRECRRKQYREYLAKNREKNRLASKHYYETHKKEHMEYNREYRKKHPDRTAECQKYYQTHKDEIRERNRPYNRAYMKRRKAEDPVYALSMRVHTNLHDAFRRRGHIKDAKCAELTGLCSSDLTAHLLETFRNNYGREWDGVEAVHIDHIIPLATAESIDDVKRLCHYTNLQLLTAKDNQHKHDKLDYELTTPQERM